MTYNVFGGMSSLTQSINQSLLTTALTLLISAKVHVHTKTMIKVIIIISSRLQFFNFII